MKIIKKLFLCTLIIFQLLLTGCEKKEEPYLAYFNKGEDYFYDKNNPKAIEYFDKSIENNNTFPNAYILRANAYTELKEYGKAEKDLQIVINGNYKQYYVDTAYYMMFFVYSKQHNREKAFEYLDKSLSGKGEFFKTNPMSIAKGYMELYEVSLLKDKRFLEAKNVATKALEYFPDEYKHYVSLAYIEEKHHSNSDKALSYLKKAKELSGGEITQDPETSLKNLKKMN